MDVREKLAELLKTNACPSPFICDQACKYYGYGDCFPCRFADHLISNGVTVQDSTEISDELLQRLRNEPITVITEETSGEVVQEWISVKDRLPDTEDVFLCWSKDLADMMFCYTSDFMQMEVSHWMPLPEPPRGD